MKFDIVIGNPPYQDNTIGDNDTFAPPVYDKFMSASYTISNKVELIHPARFLFNAGSTPKSWNNLMLQDKNLKILSYWPKSKDVFANTDRVQVRNTNITNNQIAGNKIKVIDAKAGSAQQVGANTTAVNSNNEQILMVKQGNKYTASQIKTKLEENECICGVTLIGVDTEVVSPNKEILVTYEDSKLQKQYGGNYRVCRTTTTLTKDASELVGEVQVVLKKQK